MTSTVFISGSRHIRCLSAEVKNRLRTIVDKQFNVLVGDANGVDKAVQKYLAEIDYQLVRVFCSGSVCRNNLGNWSIEWIAVDPKLTGRAFYTQKDKAMAAQADYGFVLWDGKSQGSWNNLQELIKHDCRSLLWYAPDKHFYNIVSVQDLQRFIPQSVKLPVQQLLAM